MIFDVELIIKYSKENVRNEPVELSTYRIIRGISFIELTKLVKMNEFYSNSNDKISVVMNIRGVSK